MTTREDLAQELKQARLDAGYKTHGALAKKLHIDRSVVTRAEQPLQPVPSDAVLKSWADATDANLKTLIALAERARNGSPEWFVEYLGQEQQATVIRCWAPLVVPGLFQTEPYARHLIAVKRYTPGRLDELVAARMKRQQIIGRAHITAVIDAMVLQRCIGSPRIMAEQCSRLVALSEHPDIALHVVEPGVNVGMEGAFDIASHGSMTTVNLTTVRDIPSTESAMVDETVQAWEQILGASLPLPESLDCFQKLEGHWKEQI